MKKVFILILILLIAGCAGAAVDEANAPIIVENVTAEEPVEVVDVVEPVVISSDKDQVMQYLEENPLDQFNTLPGRVLTVLENTKNATLTYRVSTADPAQESTYLAGVLFQVFPEITSVDIQGLNDQGVLIESSHKFPVRDGYVYPTVWFPTVTYNECTISTDCNDNDECTKDVCVNTRCSNSRVIKDGCTA